MTSLVVSVHCVVFMVVWIVWTCWKYRDQSLGNCTVCLDQITEKDLSGEIDGIIHWLFLDHSTN